MEDQRSGKINLAGPCGIYCGACRHYLARTKGLLKEKKLKDGCKGCRIQNKKCSWVKKDCMPLRKSQVEFCYECNDFPCANLDKLNQRHIHEDNVNLIDNLLRIKTVGVDQWLKEQEDKFRCPRCGGNTCTIDGECYDCGYKTGKSID